MKGMNEMEEFDQVFDELGRSLLVFAGAVVVLIVLVVGWMMS